MLVAEKLRVKLLPLRKLSESSESKLRIKVKDKFDLFNMKRTSMQLNILGEDTQTPNIALKAQLCAL